MNISINIQSVQLIQQGCEPVHDTVPVYIYSCNYEWLASDSFSTALLL